MDANHNAEELLRLVNGDAWHGPSLRELLDGLSVEQALAHPLKGRHSIWEIVNHITVWHNAVNVW
ncbi:MAG TPA: DinB family protein [Balneolales bacterium]|nr:DinB family protein [Balneolales bacterium]